MAWENWNQRGTPAVKFSTYNHPMKRNEEILYSEYPVYVQIMFIRGCELGLSTSIGQYFSHKISVQSKIKRAFWKRNEAFSAFFAATSRTLIEKTYQNFFLSNKWPAGEDFYTQPIIVRNRTANDYEIVKKAKFCNHGDDSQISVQIIHSATRRDN